MNVGQGNIAFYPKEPTIPAPGPPFAPTSADNGLSVDPVSGRIVLGNDLGGTGAELLSSREIETFGLLFQLLAFGNRTFVVDPGTSSYSLGDRDGGASGMHLFIDASNGVARIADTLGELLTLDRPNQLYTIGDVTGGGNDTKLVITDTGAGSNITGYANNLPGLSIADAIQEIGDVGNNSNFLKLSIDNTAQELLQILGQTGGGGGQVWFRISQLLRLIEMGDVSDTTNQTKLSIDDTNLLTTIEDIIGPKLLIDGGNSLYQFGQITNGNGTVFEIIDSLRKAVIRYGAAPILSLDKTTGFYVIGDLTAGVGLLVDENLNVVSITGQFQTGSTALSSGLWRLGSVTAGAVVLDAANYVDVEINGTPVKLLIAA